MNLNVIQMRITPLLSIILLLLVSKASIFGQCNPKPIADFSVNGFCETDSAIFINLSQNAEYYLWKFGDGKTSDKHSPKYFYHQYHIGNVTLVAKDSNGCADSITKNATMYSNPNSDFSFTINQNEVTFTPKQIGSTSYQWYFGNGDSLSMYKVTYTYTKPTRDTVCLKVINAAGCFSKTCKEILITVDISRTLNQNSFKIYPNPNSGSFIIKFDASKTNRTIEIINEIGQIIQRKEFNQSPCQLDLNFAKGIYFVKVNEGEKVHIQRIMINK